MADSSSDSSRPRSGSPTSGPDSSQESSSQSGPDTGPPSGASDTWYKQQWATLCDVLNTEDPSEVVPRVQTLKDRFDNLDELDGGMRSPEGLVTISEVEEVFQEMHEKLQKLRERNAALIDRLEDEEGSGVQSAFKELHQETEDLLDALGVTSMDEARDRVRSLNRQLDNLYREKERLVEAGLTSADEALETINELQAERDQLADDLSDLQQKHDDLQDDVARLRDETGAAGSSGDAEDTEAIQAERDRLQEEVDHLEAENDQLQEQNQHLQDATRDLQERADELQEEVQSLRDANESLEAENEQLQDENASLTQENQSLTEETTALEETLAERNDDVDRLEDRVEALETKSASLRDERDRLQSERDRFQAERNRLESQVDQLETKVAQLREQEESRPSPDTSVLEAASAVKNILGVTSPDEAQTLAHAVETMHDRMQRLAQERDRITAEAGVEAPGDVLAMIHSMEEQLEDLYADRDAETSSGPSIPEELRDILGIASVDEATDLAQTVRRMGERLQSLDAERARIADSAGVDTADDVLAMIQSMEDQLVDLYEQANTSQTPSEPSTAGDAGAEGEASDDDPSAVDAEIGRALGVSSVDEARELEQLVHDMTDRLERLSREHEKLEEAGLTVDNALTMIESMEDQLVDLYQDREGTPSGPPSDDAAPMSPESDAASSEPSSPSRASEETDSGTGASDIFSTDTLFGDTDAGGDVPTDDDKQRELLERINSELGVSDPDEVEELSQLVRSMTTQLNHLTEQQAKLTDLGLSVDNALMMIENMEEQLVDLYGDREDEADAAVRERLNALQQILGVSTPEEARELEASVRLLEERLRELLDEKNAILERTGLRTVDNVASMIDSMEEQLVDLYQEREAMSDAQERLSAIEDVLGISSRAEAQELAGIARSMEEQLDDLYEDKQKLEAVGLDSVEDAINMITSMEDQLVELYEDKESVQDLSSVQISPEQDTFQQLESLYAEQEKLKRELGVASADEIIEMVEGLSTQLDELYADRDAEASGDVDALLPEDYDTESLSVSGDGSSSSAATEAAPREREAEYEMMIASMRQQLEALYDEKDVLLEHGMGDAREAISHIDNLRQQIRALNERTNEYEERFERLTNEVGVSSVTQVIKTVRTLRSQAQSPKKDVAASSSRSTDASGAGSDTRSGGSGGDGGDSSGAASSGAASAEKRSAPSGLTIDAAPKFVDDDTLRRLEQMSSDELDALDFGAIRLSDRGKIEYVNEAGLTLPGLKSVDDRTTIADKNFFLEVAPSTNNNLFFGRFKQGVQQGAMDARFPYTFISPGKGPTVLIVHLHRKHDAGVNWLLFQPM